MLQIHQKNYLIAVFLAFSFRTYIKLNPACKKK